MEPDDPVPADEGLIRRMRAIDKAGADSNFDPATLSAIRAEFAGYSDKELKDLAGMHFLFRDDADPEVMAGFWLSTRLAAERLASRPDCV